MNPLQGLAACGQSVWLDSFSRKLIHDGELARLINDDAITGITTNPAIYATAMAGSNGSYQDAIERWSVQGLNAEAIARILIIEDVTAAADQLRAVYQRTGGKDGFVSVEVSPSLANDSDGTVREARALWTALNRPNVLIKVPATPAGITATRQLLTEGINVNSTLLFWLTPYARVAEAYLAALEVRDAAGLPLASVASVASFFLSRIDTLLDAMLARVAQQGQAQARVAESLRGKGAVACAKLAYRHFHNVFHSARYAKLAERGAPTQRLLWASTSTKNPDYPDTKYIEPLVGPDTITTLPLGTLTAYKDHGQPEITLPNGTEIASQIISQLTDIGIDMGLVGETLEKDGVRQFAAAFGRMLGTIAKQQPQSGATLAKQSLQ